MTAQDEILLATKELIYALSQKNKHSPVQLPTKFYNALKKFSEIYHDTVENHPTNNDTNYAPITTSTDSTTREHLKITKQQK